MVNNMLEYRLVFKVKHLVVMEVLKSLEQLEQL